MITDLDTQVGRIVAALKQKNMLDNTLIVFSSDNGGATSALFATGARSPEERAGKRRCGTRRKDAGLERRSSRRQGFAARRRRAGAHHLLLAREAQAKHRQRTIGYGGCDADRAGTRRGQKAARIILRRQKHLAEFGGDQPSPHEDILINVEAFRGAIRKGNWKLVKIALLPGKTELFDLAKDPERRITSPSQFPEIVNDLEARLLAYANEMKPSMWIKAQPAFLGAQGKTLFDPDFDIDDGGLPHEKAVVPR